MALFEHIDMKHLSAVEQEIYCFVINHVEKIPYMRVRDIADEAHVSSSSVFRFVQKAGFTSFPEFRFYIKNFLDKTRQEDEKHQLSIEQRLAVLNMDIFHPDVDYQIQKMATALKEAEVIIFLGLGSSGAMAQYAARRLSGLGYFSLSINEITYPMKGFFKKNQAAAMVFLSISGETKEILEVARSISSQSTVKRYAITQNKESTLSKLCDYSIGYAIEEIRKEIYFDLTSQLPAVAILETLIGYLEE